MRTTKLTLDDITPAMLERSAQIMDAVVLSQSAPACVPLGRLALIRILRKYWCGLLNDGLNAGIHAGLNDGLYAGLYAGLDAGLHDGLDAGLRAGLRAGLNAGLNDRLGKDCCNLRLCYCGVWWSWWLCRYLIAAEWGCKIDMTKLFLLRAFCLLCPIIGERDSQPVILPKPSSVRWRRIGMTSRTISLPIWELHSDGQPSIEYWGLFDLYHHHNTKIPARMGKVRPDAWKPEWLLDEPNAEVRRWLVTELGLDRIRHKLGGELIHETTVVLRTPLAEQWPCHYRLERLRYGERERRVLVMPNPSLPDVTHVEYVPTECETVEAAMNFRLNRTEDDIDDNNGSPYWLHGDVVIKPNGANHTKRWPEAVA